MIVALWGRDQLAEDSGVEDGGGWGGVTLAHNVGSPPRWTTVIAEAEAAGATIAAPRRGDASGAATRASSSTPTAIRGRSPTTRTGRSLERRRSISPAPSNRLLQGGEESARFVDSSS